MKIGDNVTYTDKEGWSQIGVVIKFHSDDTVTIKLQSTLAPAPFTLKRVERSQIEPAGLEGK
jgi:hypothetical protein